MKKFRNCIALLLCAVMVLGLCACSSGGSAKKGNVVTIGVFEPASGDNGAGGKQETLGIQYANHCTPTVSIGGTEYTVELKIVDNESSNDKAASAASELVSAGSSIVLGSYGSSVSIAGGPTFDAAGIPVMGVTCTNPQVTEGNDYYFRICYLDPFQGTVLANYAYNTLGVTKAYCLSKLGDDYSGGLVNYFVEAFKALGGECVEATFPDGNSDFTSYIASANSEGCGVFFSPVSIEAAQLIIDQCNSQGVNIPLLAGDTWDSNMVTAAAQGTDLDVYVTTFYAEGGDRQFDNLLKSWLNTDKDALTANGGNDSIAAVTAMGYDAYYVALEAIKAAGSTDPAKVKEALWNVNYTGVTGAIAFNEIGDAVRDTAFIKHCDTAAGTWETIGQQGIN